MSIFVQIGQCGNQVGDALWSMLEKHHEKEAMHKFFRSNGAPRCILVDTEPKVIQSILNSSQYGTKINPESVHYQQYGRGNNWAMGYHGRKRLENYQPFQMVATHQYHSSYNQEDTPDSFFEEIMNSIRKELERLDYCDGIYFIHSLAGGTGSGMSSRLLEMTRSWYPNLYLTNIVIAPSLKGDTPLQNYNAILTFEKLQTFSDCIIYKENDDLQRMVQYWRGFSLSTMSKNSKQYSTSLVTMDQMNQAIAGDLFGLFIPGASAKRGQKPSPAQFQIAELITNVCPMSQTKFIDVRSGFFCAKKSTQLLNFIIPKVAEDNLLKLCQRTCQAFPRAHTSRSVGTQIAIHGFECQNEEVVSMVTKALPHVEWNPTTSLSYGSTCSRHSPSNRGHVFQASMVIATNRTQIRYSIDQIFQRALRQFDARAYLHWYAKYGIERADFEQAFENCHRIIQAYQVL